MIAEGLFKGLSVMPSSNNPQLLAPPLGVDFGLRGEDDEYTWYQLKSPPSREIVLSSCSEHPQWICIVDSDNKDEIIQLFQGEYGIQLDKDLFQDTNIKSASINSKFEILELILRSCYKALFNFFAYTLVKRNMTHILYNPCFDPLKRYIKNGVRPMWDVYPPLEFINQPVIINEEPGKAIHAHVITFEVNPDASVTGSIAFYNKCHFRLTLAKEGYPGIVDWKFGQLFCTNTKEVIDLQTEGIFV